MPAPRAAHRFVAYLEEEAVKTYSSAIESLDRGEIPEWEKQVVPTVAKDYWRLGDKATSMSCVLDLILPRFRRLTSLLSIVRDLLLAVRADEAGHR